METEISFVDEPQVGFVDRRRKVWLECDGEPYDFRSVEVVATGDDIGDDVSPVTFICPHCGEKHESLLFI
jgi:hypothetical protein